MTRRRRIHPKEDGPPDTIDVIITDAVESAAEAADEASADIREIVHGSLGLSLELR